MASSEVKICNLALSHIGASRITNLTESTKAARECSTLYDTLRDAVLRANDWGFARKRLTLALLDAAYSGWDYAYAYPVDCVAAREIYDGTGALTGTSYDIDSDRYVPIGKIQFEIASNEDLNGKIILTDQEEAELIYTAKVTDPNMFDTLFIDALSWRLAADLAVPLRGDTKLHTMATQKYLAIIAAAKPSDANESERKPDHVNTFKSAR